MSRVGESETTDFPPTRTPRRRFFGTDPAPVRLECAGRSHPGKVREENQDHFAVVRRYRTREVLATSLPETLLRNREQEAFVMAVADGMGGHVFGELASLLAFRTGWDIGLDEVKWQLKIDDDEIAELMEKMRVGFEMVDRAIMKQMWAEPRLAGMGTTFTGAYAIGLELILGHVGDSRAYLVREGALERLTRDHTLAQELADRGAIAPDEVDTHHFRHVLTNCLGGPNLGVHPDITHVALQDQDTILLCTDGLNEVVSDEEFQELLGPSPECKSACDRLIELALARNSPDNVTAVLGRFHVVRS